MYRRIRSYGSVLFGVSLLRIPSQELMPRSLSDSGVESSAIFTASSLVELRFLALNHLSFEFFSVANWLKAIVEPLYRKLILILVFS